MPVKREITFGPCLETSFSATSRWTQSQTLLAERRIIPYSTEIHWCIQNYSYELECYARETHRWLLEYRWITRLVWLLDRFHSVFCIDGYVWSGVETDKKAAITSRPDHLWSEHWTKLGRNAQLKEKQKWSHEQPKLDNARKLWGIYFIDPEDNEFKETIKNSRKKLETPMAPAMPCKTSKTCEYVATRGKTNEFQSKLARILEASESTRLRMEESLTNYYEDHIAGKVDNSLQHKILVHKFIPMPQVMKIPASKAAVDKEWEKLEKIPAWDLTKVRS